jgi:hypothetical protein
MGNYHSVELRMTKGISQVDTIYSTNWKQLPLLEEKVSQELYELLLLIGELVEESGPQSVLELSPALFNRTEFRQGERHEGKIVTDTA